MNYNQRNQNLRNMIPLQTFQSFDITTFFIQKKKSNLKSRKEDALRGTFMDIVRKKNFFFLVLILQFLENIKIC